jgi:hypothetical protein
MRAQDTGEFEMIDAERLAQALPISDYGRGEAKSFQQLLDEIKKGEIEIIWQSNQPIRLLSIVLIKVCYQDKILFEDRQEFADGRVRHRGIEGISEKLLPQEEPDKAVYRALQEELGFHLEELRNLSVAFLAQEASKKESPSYPGLESHYDIYKYKTYIPDSLYKPEYVELNQDSRKTYFIWR